MIKVCKEPGDLSPIFHLKDKFDSTYVSCSRSEFFQFLVENVKNDRVRIIIDLGEDEKTAKGYVVCVNAVIPPLSNCIAMTYSFSGPGCDMDTIIRRIAKWGKKMGAKRISAQTSAPNNDFEKFGFKEVARAIERKID